MVENNWQTIWNKRKTDYNNFSVLDDKQIAMELRRLDGFDISESAITYEAFVKEANKTVEYLFTSPRRGQQSLSLKLAVVAA